jgi:hypothetical protein
MTRFYVEFSVPVIAIVEDGKVVRVAVSDEEIKLTKERVAAYDSDGVEADCTEAQADEARKIADGDEVWPVWEFGF